MSTYDLESVSDIDSQIAAMEVQLGLLRTRRNYAASPLYRIPDDIISDILTQLQLNLQRDGCLRYWARAVVTSRRIHRIAVESPNLWSYFEITQQSDKDEVRLGKWIKACVTWGGTQPASLILDFGSFSDLSSSLSRDIMRLSSRTSDLWIKDSCMRQNRAVYTPIVKSSWPTLLNLRIETTSEESLITTQLLGSSSASLISLILVHRYPDDKERAGIWNYIGLPHLPNLRQLTIMGLNFTSIGNQLQDDLSRTPLLAQLSLQRLSGSFDQSRTYDPSRYDRFLDLPHLRYLHLDGSPKAICSVLVILPSSPYDISISTDFRVETTSTNDLITIMAWVSERVQRLTTQIKGPWLKVSLCILEPERTSLVRLYLSSPRQSRLSAPVNNGSIQYFGCWPLKDLPLLVGIADHLEFDFGSRDYLSQTLATLATAYPTIPHLSFSRYSNILTDKQRVSRQEFENYLVARKDKGYPLSHLQVRLDTVQLIDKKLAQWLKDGLVSKLSIDKHYRGSDPDSATETKTYTLNDLNVLP